MDAELYGKLGLLAETKPYSLEKPGFVLGEGSVSLIVEKASSAEKRGAAKYAEVAGCAMAHHAVEFGTVSGSEDALAKAVEAACADAGISVSDIDAVSGFANGHKTIDELEKAGWDVGVAWQDGRMFHGPCAIRMNLALPLSRVKEAFDRLDKYVFNAE